MGIGSAPGQVKPHIAVDPTFIRLDLIFLHVAPDQQDRAAIPFVRLRLIDPGAAVGSHKSVIDRRRQIQLEPIKCDALLLNPFDLRWDYHVDFLLILQLDEARMQQ